MDSSSMPSQVPSGGDKIRGSDNEENAIAQGLGQMNIVESAAPPEEPSVKKERKRGEESENDKVVSAYLREKSSLFKDLHRLREEGWKKKELDEANLANQLANQDPEKKKKLHDKNIETAEEFKKKLGGRWPGEHVQDCRLLDLCFAPGGFSRAFLETGGGSSRGISLLMKESTLNDCFEHENFQREIYDITLLADEFGQNNSELKTNDPFERDWSSKRPFDEDGKFPLVMCDGHIIREEDESEDQHQLKISRLLVSQLILALQGVDEGKGTIMIRLYTPDKWESVKIIHRSTQFVEKRDIKIFKSDKRYQGSSVIYLIVSNLKPGKKLAETVQSWKDDWYKTMLGGPHKEGELLIDKGGRHPEGVGGNWGVVDKDKYYKLENSAKRVTKETGKLKGRFGIRMGVKLMTLNR